MFLPFHFFGVCTAFCLYAQRIVRNQRDLIIERTIFEARAHIAWGVTYRV